MVYRTLLPVKYNYCRICASSALNLKKEFSTKSLTPGILGSKLESMTKPVADLLEDVAIKALVPRGYKGLVRKGLRVLKDIKSRAEALQPRTPQLPERRTRDE